MLITAARGSVPAASSLPFDSGICLHCSPSMPATVIVPVPVGADEGQDWDVSPSVEILSSSPAWCGLLMWRSWSWQSDYDCDTVVGLRPLRRAKQDDQRLWPRLAPNDLFGVCAVGTSGVAVDADQ